MQPGLWRTNAKFPQKVLEEKVRRLPTILEGRNHERRGSDISVIPNLDYPVFRALPSPQGKQKSSGRTTLSRLSGRRPLTLANGKTVARRSARSVCWLDEPLRSGLVTLFSYPPWRSGVSTLFATGRYVHATGALEELEKFYTRGTAKQRARPHGGNRGWLHGLAVAVTRAPPIHCLRDQRH